MKIYKEKQFLIFDYEDGKTCKYDFAQKAAYGRSGKRVKDLRTQLSGLTVGQMCDMCTDKNYGRFLRFVARNASYSGCSLQNIGSILSRVPRYARFEQIFSAGFDDVISSNFDYTINDIPKGIISLCRNHSIQLSNDFLTFYKEMPDAYQIAYKLEYTSLTDEDVYKILRTSRWASRHEYRPYFNDLILQYGYNAKALMKYMDDLKTFEALNDCGHIIRELYDYASMMSKISPHLDRHPRHFLTTFKIATRNYNRLNITYNEEEFSSRYNPEMEYACDGFTFIYPKTTQDIKDEAVQQNNCVSGYIKRVIEGKCDILFLRRKDSPNASLVTIEVQNGKIVQALQRFNNPITDEQRCAVNKWNKWYEKKLKEKEKENAA